MDAMWDQAIVQFDTEPLTCFQDAAQRPPDLLSVTAGLVNTRFRHLLFNPFCSLCLLASFTSLFWQLVDPLLGVYAHVF